MLRVTQLLSGEAFVAGTQSPCSLPVMHFGDSSLRSVSRLVAITISRSKAVTERTQQLALNSVIIVCLLFAFMGEGPSESDSLNLFLRGQRENSTF